MRKSVIFLILWSLLCLGRVGDALYSYGQFRVARGLELIYTTTPIPKEEDSETRLRIAQSKSEWTDRAVTAGVEVVLLIGICWVYFRKDKEAARQK